MSGPLVEGALSATPSPRPRWGARNCEACGKPMRYRDTGLSDRYDCLRCGSVVVVLRPEPAEVPVGAGEGT